MRSGGQLLARLGKFNLVGLLGAALQLLLLCPAARYPLPYSKIFVLNILPLKYSKHWSCLYS